MSGLPFYLTGKKILVTGASSGIGKAVALACAEAGAEIFISGRNAERLKETNDLAKNATSIIADLREKDAIGSICEQCPLLDGIVHSAGIIKSLPFKMLKEESLDEIMQVNFHAPIMLTQQLLQQRKIAKGGSIVYISSISGTIIGAKANGAYSASKAAFEGMMKSVALELANQKIRMNSIAPGMVRTEMWNGHKAAITAEQLAEDEKKYPLGYGEAVDVAWASVYLLSEASKWITGSTMVLDGGFSIQ